MKTSNFLLQLSLLLAAIYAGIQFGIFEKISIFIITGAIPYTPIVLSPTSMLFVLIGLALAVLIYARHTIYEHYIESLPALIDINTEKKHSPAARRAKTAQKLHVRTSVSRTVKRNNSLRPQLKLFKKKMLTLINSFGQLRQRRRVSDETSA